ncbi:MAG: outer membrane protein assembly factor, partial [Duncaniella sp.]|nr:outer membrane protein assembly factor [Duncaniella sp.]
MKSASTTVIAALATAILLLVTAGCRSTRLLPEGTLLLDHVNIQVEGDSVKESELVSYLRQSPNHRTLGFMKLQLAMYNLSGRDTTKWYNRWVRRMGQAPVAWSPDLTDASVKQLRQALVNRGYMDASVTADSAINREGRKVDITYR